MVREIMACVLALFISGGVALAGETVVAGKAIRVTVSGVPEKDQSALTGNYPVSNEGFLNLPYIGKIKAVGLTYEELGKALDRIYLESGIYMAAKFQVGQPRGCGPPLDTVIVGGQVKKPGELKFSKGMTVGQAIAAVGGLTEFADPKRIKLIRNGQLRVGDLSEQSFANAPLQLGDVLEVVGWTIDSEP